MAAKESFTLEEVQKLMYQALKVGEGGHAEDKWNSRLALRNKRLATLRYRFPKVFGKGYNEARAFKAVK